MVACSAASSTFVLPTLPGGVRLQSASRSPIAAPVSSRSARLPDPTAVYFNRPASTSLAVGVLAVVVASKQRKRSHRQVAIARYSGVARHSRGGEESGYSRGGEEAGFTSEKASGGVSTAESTNLDDGWRITLLYDGECPTCMKQVEFLIKRMDENPEYAGLVRFTNLADPSYDPKESGGVTYDDGMRHIHAITRDGRVFLVSRCSARSTAFSAWSGCTRWRRCQS